MVDFKTLLAAKHIVRELDARQVEGEGLSWERVLIFAKSYTETAELQIDDFVDPIVEEEPAYTLSEDQQKAWIKLQTWVYSDERYFVLRGYAGAGKTFLMKLMLQLNVETMFTAPTNKASKVLSQSIGRSASTIYSALGLKMTAEDDALVLKMAERPPYISPGTIIVVDECSMVNRELFDFIDQVAEKNRCKVLYVGDPAQLPPVGEGRSPTWQATRDTNNRSFLQKIMRYDNQLLSLATRIRQSIQDATYDEVAVDDNDGKTGVFVDQRFRKRILKHNRPDEWRDRKVIAWRNRTVNRYNDKIRESFGFTKPYHDGDILLMAEPLEIDGQIVATIDEEFMVVNVAKNAVPVYHRNVSLMVDVWTLTVTGDSEQTLYVPINEGDWKQLLSEKAMDARNAGKRSREAWREFWETKRRFHSVRYGYALTAHRAQGSTYKECFVDQQDILANRNEREAMRCLYVAVTRAQENIYSF